MRLQSRDYRPVFVGFPANGRTINAGAGKNFF